MKEAAECCTVVAGGNPGEREMLKWMRIVSMWLGMLEREAAKQMLVVDRGVEVEPSKARDTPVSSPPHPASATADWARELIPEQTARGLKTTSPTENPPPLPLSQPPTKIWKSEEDADFKILYSITRRQET